MDDCCISCQGYIEENENGEKWFADCCGFDFRFGRVVCRDLSFACEK